ncbi:hypothetical protein AEA09_12900 [Lysinibacillus contaminans]|uniref:Uncharacterized protein n=1 Tax=Lysinibacillus contaminans TaxID=1293441 RepID=A0ABR5K3L9_9BACI|nr:hypothetical protein [Lysinibacillus contaminans]KOS69368.1 hypothetical protein AEA09_12900 [Lysinibacillus contaminans]
MAFAFPQESSDASPNNAIYHIIILHPLSFIIKGLIHLQVLIEKANKHGKTIKTVIGEATFSDKENIEYTNEIIFSVASTKALLLFLQCL